MTKSVFLEKYPINSLEIAKNETTYTNVDSIIEFFKAKIDNDNIATFIATFDHFSHTTKIEGEINPEIKDAKHIIFCFGTKIPTAKMLAARPRSIGVVELEDSFSINFLEAPAEPMNDLMVSWAKELIK